MTPDELIAAFPCGRHHHHFDGQGFFGPADTESVNASETCPGFSLPELLKAVCELVEEARYAESFCKEGQTLVSRTVGCKTWLTVVEESQREAGLVLDELSPALSLFNRKETDDEP